MPLISVIVPVYKVEPYLHECVDSILNQSFKDFELILVDDGSPDNCPAICDKYAIQDKRVKVIHKENGGLSSARNAGLDYVFANSNSEYLFFVDSDDYISEECLFNAIETAKSNDADLVVLNYNLLFNDKSIVKSKEIKHIVLNSRSFWEWNMPGAIKDISCNKLFNRNLFLNLRYPIGKCHEDAFLIHYLVDLSNRIVAVNDYTYFYRQHDKSIMKNRNEKTFYDAYQAKFDRGIFFYEKEWYVLSTEWFLSSKKTLIENVKGYLPNSFYKNTIELTNIYLKKAFKKTRKKELGLRMTISLWMEIYCARLKSLLQKLIHLL